MLSIFPELLTFSYVGVTIVRVTIGLVLLYIGLMTTGIKKTTYKNNFKIKEYPFSNIIPMVFGFIEIVTGLFLIAGFLTQLMAIIAIYLFLNLIFIEKHIGRVFDYSNLFYISLILISVAILFLGPGIFAFDLPL
jgi:uncharacterized membrane protein YphA (DoxX/SURF4 family)